MNAKENKYQRNKKKNGKFKVVQRWGKYGCADKR